MFNVKRNGASVEITDIPLSIPFGVFKDIADKTGANECLIAYVKDKDCYEVVIHHDSVNMAGAVAWLVLEASKKEKHEISIKYKNELPPDYESRNMDKAVMIAVREVSREMEKHKVNSLFKPCYILVI
ncbi:TPA_asm: hypothetical protein G3V02_002966 [Salmonella enterica subsp. enterica serovar Ank]|uniref:Uncharacterized protein n=1 Tax=Salmonella enterica subsp. enterica serovar Ank TaxID=1173578 RepID=A0A5I2X0S5_SALET|nr:hypothetical protein [Salmonella enterica subsp. enterica serovar Pomona]ECF3882178.1 hypothetical protein [Salmonella enterica subsp. enterica serovar Ank]EDX5411992.1 hypothetical protein [Salmonella enterica subsp. enterica serovar Ealing]EEJ1799840.1 hypothetical protein [Salmonella enterica subsp. enterica serovar Pomona]HAE1794235.1 hypothetical protein [Salmonella enterica subsp. enterica serovar Ank]